MLRRCTLRVLMVVLATLTLALDSTTTTYGHAGFDRSEPAPGGMVEAGPFVLRVWFTQAVSRTSFLQVYDENWNQVDLLDGAVDTDDPDRKMMRVSVPDLPPGAYTVYWWNHSLDDDHDAEGYFRIGIGMTPPAAVDTLPTVESTQPTRSSQAVPSAPTCDGDHS